MNLVPDPLAPLLAPPARKPPPAAAAAALAPALAAVQAAQVGARGWRGKEEKINSFRHPRWEDGVWGEEEKHSEKIDLRTS